MSAMPRPAQPMAPRYFFRTAGHTTFVMSMWRRCWRRRAIGDRPLFARLSHDALSFQRHLRNGQPSAIAVAWFWADLPASSCWVERPQARSQQAGRRHRQGIGSNSRPAVPPTNQNNCTANTRNSHPSAERTSFVALHSKHHFQLRRTQTQRDDHELCGTQQGFWLCCE